MGFGYQVLGLGTLVAGSELSVQVSRVSGLKFGFKALGSNCVGFSGSGFRDPIFGIWVSGFGNRVQGAGVACGGEGCSGFGFDLKNKSDPRFPVNGYRFGYQIPGIRLRV